MAVALDLPTPDEVAAMSPAALEGALVEIERARRVVEAAMTEVLDVADQRGVWRVDGHRGVRNWALALTGVSPAEASRRCSLMRATRQLSELRERLWAGEVGVCQARELARTYANPRVRERLSHAEALLVRIARRRCFDDFHQRLGRWSAVADPGAAAQTHDQVHARRRAWLRVTPAGVTLGGHGGTAQGAHMLEVFGAYAAAEFELDWVTARERFGESVTPEMLDRTHEQRQFDALWAIFAAAATRPHPELGRPLGIPTVDIIVDQQTFEEHLLQSVGVPDPATSSPVTSGPAATANAEPVTVDVFERRCETSRGLPIDPRAAVAAAVLGRVRRVVYDSSGVVIDLGRSRRLFTGSSREAVWLQGRQCLWPGCGLDADEQDHNEGWGRGGDTSPGNGGPACGRHNLWKERGYLVWRESDGTWRVVRPDGSPLHEPRVA